MSDAGILDFAGIETPVSGADSETFDLDSIGSEVQPVEGQETKIEGQETKVEGQETKVEGQEIKVEGQEQKVEGQEQKVTPTEANPDSVRKALKSWRDSDAKNAAIVKELHNSYERYQAATKVFPTVAEMRAAKEFIDLVGGQDGYDKLSSMVKSVEASDQKLYSGDPSLWDDVIEDLKGEGKLDSLGKLAPAFFENLQKYDKEGYYSAFAPHFLAGIEEVNLPGAIAAVAKVLELPQDAKPEQIAAAVAEAKKIVAGMSDWYKGLKQTSETAKSKRVDPERLKLDEERKRFNEEQEKFKTNQSKEFQKSVGAESLKHDNEKLGSHLKNYLKMPFFKGFPRETLVDLAKGIQSRLYATLEADAIYQKQMKALWGAKDPDRQKILDYHKGKIDTIAAEVVRQTVQSRYPGYAKGGSAAGRIAAKEEKKTVQIQVEQKATAEGKPIYVMKKPDWDSIDWDKDPKQYLYAAGKAYLKGSGKFVTWRK